MRRPRQAPGPGLASVTRSVNPNTGDVFSTDRRRIQVIHRNGLREELGNGRYRMKDAKGRTIVDRRATNKDSARMRDLRSR